MEIGIGTAPEIRIDPLKSGRQSGPGRVATTGYISGTCGYNEGRSPNTIGSSVLYSEIRGDCERHSEGGEEVFTHFAVFSPFDRTLRTAPAGPGLLVAIARDHATIYWISDIPAEPHAIFQDADDCNPTHSACTLMRTDELALGRPKRNYEGDHLCREVDSC